MALRVIEGNWEEVSRQVDLHGRRVRVEIDDQRKHDVLIRATAANQPGQAALPADNPWLKTLQAWADSHTPLDYIVDDSRDALYEDLSRDRPKADAVVPTPPSGRREGAEFGVPPLGGVGGR